MLSRTYAGVAQVGVPAASHVFMRYAVYQGSSSGPNGFGITNLPRCTSAARRWWRNTSAVSPFDRPYGEKAGRPSEPAPSPLSKTLPVRRTCGSRSAEGPEDRAEIGRVALQRRDRVEVLAPVVRRLGGIVREEVPTVLPRERDEPLVPNALEHGSTQLDRQLDAAAAKVVGVGRRAPAGTWR